MRNAQVAILCGMLALVLLSGCGGVGPSTPAAPTAGIAVVDAIDADTSDPIAVEATAVVGGVRGAVTVAEGSVVLRDVPFGTATPPTQPCTVTAPGYVTVAEPIQISMTVVTFFTATMPKADLNETGTVRGKITDKAGNALVSALVKFTNIGPAATEVRGYTDKDGIFTIGGIPIGVNTVTAEAPGFVTSTTQATVVQDASGGINPDVNVSLLSGDTRLDVAGTVVDAFSGKPLPGATVKFGDAATTQTNASGAFTISNVLVGPYTVTVTLTGYDQLDQQVEVLPGMGRLRLAMTITAPQPPGGPYNLAGKVTLNGRPDNSGVTVTGVSTATAQELGHVITTASGEYTMFLPPGEYRITATYGARSVRRTVLVPGGGRVVTGIDFVLTADAAAAGRAAATRLLPRRR